MAFPTIPTTAAGTALTAVQANTTATRTFPNLSSLTKNSGDLLIAIVVGYQSSLTSNIFSAWGGGFTEFHDSGGSSQMCVGMAYKWSDGTETGTFTVTQGGTITGQAGLILLAISGVNATTPPEAGGRAVGTTAAADPASLTPAGWAAEDTLWIVVRGAGETATTGSFTGLSTPATNYTGSIQTGISQDVVGGVEAGVAFRQLNAASEDPGAGTCDVSNARNVAVVVAIRPAAITFPTQFQGFRVEKGGAPVELSLVAIADAPTGMGGQLRIQKGATTYAVYLVETTDANASALRIQTTTGTKAIRLLV